MKEVVSGSLFTIITVSYNSAETISQTLASVQSQVGTTAEHLVIDGASTDGSLALAMSYIPISQIVSEHDNGIYDAMNKGLLLAKGEIVGFLNADDFYASPFVLKKVAKVFIDESVDACYGDLCYVDYNDTDKVVRYWQSKEYNYRKFYNGWMPPHPTFFVRKSVYDRLGFFNLGLGSAADYELMLRFLVRQRLKAAYVPEVLVKMRTGGLSNSTVTNRLRANKMDRLAWTVNGLRPYPWTLTMKPLRKIGQWMCKPPIK